MSSKKIEHSLGGQVAIITGGASGIGKEISDTLAANGAKVYIADIDVDAAAATASEINAGGAAAAALVCNVADPDSVAAAVEQVAESEGRIDILVHCAAIFARGAVLDLDFDAWKRVIDVNLNGTFLITREVARHMSSRKSGSIVLMTSDRGLYGAPDNSPYAASKGGMIAHMHTLALELASSNVTVNAINPGTTITERLLREATAEHIKKREESDPMGRLSTTEDIAGLTLFLVSPAGRFMTGQLVTTRVRQG